MTFPSPNLSAQPLLQPSLKIMHKGGGEGWGGKENYHNLPLQDDTKFDLSCVEWRGARRAPQLLCPCPDGATSGATCLCPPVPACASLGFVGLPPPRAVSMGLSLPAPSPISPSPISPHPISPCPASPAHGGCTSPLSRHQQCHLLHRRGQIHGTVLQGDDGDPPSTPASPPKCHLPLCAHTRTHPCVTTAAKPHPHLTKGPLGTPRLRARPPQPC